MSLVALREALQNWSTHHVSTTHPLFTMINTFHSSYNPPPVPPRAGYSKPQPAGNTPLVKFLSVMLLLLMILTFGGFLYLFQKLDVVLQGSRNDLNRLQECAHGSVEEECKQLIEQYRAVMEKVFQANGKVSELTGEQPSNGPAAHMVIDNAHNPEYKSSELLKSSNLLWDREHSLLQDVRLNKTRDTLIIESPGIYLLYSQVTFSKGSNIALKQTVWSTEPNKKKKELLKSFCSLNKASLDLCTTSTTGVFKLQKNQQLYVTVSNKTLLNRDSCMFGLFKLW